MSQVAKKLHWSSVLFLNSHDSTLYLSFKPNVSSAPLSILKLALDENTGSLSSVAFSKITQGNPTTVDLTRGSSICAGTFSVYSVSMKLALYVLCVPVASA